MATIQEAVIGGGCFWCVEAVFSELQGVESVVSGYAGGNTVNPTYEQVCNGSTGHAEVVKISYDADQLSYEDLLRIFLTTHDPTTLNQQGADIGTQYRSIILTESEDQSAIATQIIQEMQAHFDAPIVTEVTRLEIFYEAEAYHQKYYAHHPDQGYCAAVIAPKLQKFRKLYTDRLKRSAG